MPNFKNNSYLYGDNTKFVEGMYSRYLQGDKSIGEDWYRIFSTNLEVNKGCSTQYLTKADNSVSNLVNFFRSYGHFFSDLNPLLPNMNKEIDYQKYSNFSPTQSTVVYRDIYCKNIGFEFMHISSYKERIWLQEKIENQVYTLSSQDKREMLRHLIESEMFEQFLHIKFPGYKRFSIEGGESAIVAIEKIISNSIAWGIEEVVLGMAHRGRLNVLTKVMGKEYAAILSEFQGNLAYPSNLGVSGDVKYHLGYSSDRILADGKKVHLSLCPNPSHLEAVNPVLAGRVRAKQKIRSALGVLIHGDAAFTGQGVVVETLTLSNIKGYKVDGIVHIIINNQVGFTANPCCTRSSFYCTDIIKSIEAPVFHVSGDNPEAVSFVTSLAMEYRQKFKKDVIIDIICYRKYGHNEGDEPNLTQPLMYKVISKHKTPGTLYEEKLTAEKVLNSNEVNRLRNEFRAKLDKSFTESVAYTPKKADWFSGIWSKLRRAKLNDLNEYYTDSGVPPDKLKKLGVRINSNIPNSFNINNKIRKILNVRIDSINSGSNIDWAMAESLAFASLLTEGIEVRLSGQDSSRGTFSHRHSRLIDQITEEVFIPLNNINKKQANFEVVDSALSEYAIMGFEYGYSLDSPYSLVLWEGQFGDFANGAQVIIDQFIASAETKWLRSSGLVLLLPHGYEGQGPEHSSARIERFLQLCAEDNIQVVNCSTPANYFHVLRRQIHRDFRKPLVVFTPKSLLRHKRAVSNLSDFEGKFLTVIPEYRINLVSDNKIRKTIICSGKVYYDIIEACEAQKINDIAIIRLEQLYPFPADKLSKELEKYKNAEIVWCQEEPKNMGGWFFINPLIEEILFNLNVQAKRPKCITRPAAASPACGYISVHAQQQEEILKQVIK
ncbi:2-oxoglutarate dehydrogenase E1 component [Wolbachia endosymbiont of Dirofilaria (Dirofilaria) immitis]|uniref:2-oxoglutarate dehydrogenase E1 component n=1 Tax=Wolbachia endosymbiont of Dirofilaria (Dirofilaria) immitis TaxID=1812115 RepID=UPI00158B8BC6|nr:2-oxoglutarate dehydrogenase E1 component [Wolbachia endosymbiont of Dirofilaria (Dirofilaria) immitis]QKX02213.1 2-oxoglutarate dehydrogenase E1 component [Wolbachia endosymbiont of Dirofilaria (Dirofilaria) immitis]